ncbi:MmgE/PrpD family-domain-containing protein [Hypoxylon rubiginosum]|uniref:MmgE/PrpD family-domain-containing protein n=1 Tax=Hypoxylon rubiginosum TaxID=110542 RepID=A0ACC0CS43_9PEZI|nr:MmgE/PrpD family-domain-containing protein [Hypoxylon rubiginosum]
MCEPKYDDTLKYIIRYVYNLKHWYWYSPHVYKRARLALLDSMGCAIETLAQSLDMRTLIGPVVPGTTIPNGFRLPGTTFVLDPVKGAFDLGTLICYLGHNGDYPSAEWGRASDSLGAIVAVADWLSRCYAADNTIGRPITLQDVLTAQIQACEIQRALQADNNLNKRGLDHAILSKIASTAAIARLMRLGEEQALNLLHYAWQEEHPLQTDRRAPYAGPMKGWAAGNACSRAVHLCFLAMTSRPGMPSVVTAPVLAVPEWGFGGVLADLMESEIFIRPAAEAALEIAARLEFNEREVGDIKQMTITTQYTAKDIMSKTGPLRNRTDRDQCVQYIIAVSLIKGTPIHDEDFADDSPWASDPRVDALREKIVIVEDEQVTRASPIVVELKDGAELSGFEVGFSVGRPKHSETVDFVEKKFKANMSKGGFESVTVDTIMRLAQTNGLAIHHFIDLFAKEVPYIGS